MIEEIFDTPEKKDAFVKEMNTRFDVIIKLIHSLKIEIHSPDKLIQGKTIFCAYKLMGYLDQFVGDMHNFIEEAENSHNSLN